MAVFPAFDAVLAVLEEELAVDFALGQLACSFHSFAVAAVVEPVASFEAKLLQLADFLLFVVAIEDSGFVEFAAVIAAAESAAAAMGQKIEAVFGLEMAVAAMR